MILASVSFPNTGGAGVSTWTLGPQRFLSANPRPGGQVFPRQLRSETQHDYRCQAGGGGDKLSWAQTATLAA